MQAACVELLPRAPRGLARAAHAVGAAEPGWTPSPAGKLPRHRTDGRKTARGKKWLCEGERCEPAVRKGKITQMMLGMAGQRGAGSTNRCTFGVKKGRKMEKCPQNPQPHTSLGTLSAPFLLQSLSLKPVLKPNVRSSSASCFFARALPDSSRNLHRCKTASSEKG